MDQLEIPLNSAIWYLQTEKGKNVLINPIKYPWDLHYVIQKVLQDEVTHVSISPNASISKSTVIDGPCIIEDDVTIDDFCKIKGPAYISKGSFIGMSSLIRNCMMGDKTRIGFNCEVARSYLLGSDKISQQNIIVDSIIGENVWFGAYAATLNALSTKQKISVRDRERQVNRYWNRPLRSTCWKQLSCKHICHNHARKTHPSWYFVKPETTVAKSIGH